MSSSVGSRLGESAMRHAGHCHFGEFGPLACVQVLAMTNLVAAYQQNDIMAFERILRTNKCALHRVSGV